MNDAPAPADDRSIGRIERRCHPRYDVGVPALVRIVIPEETFTPRRFPCRCLNISAGGACVAIRGMRKDIYKLLVRDRRTVRLHISIPEAGGEVSLTSDLVRSDYRTTNRGAVCELGIAFRDLRDNQVSALDALLRSLQMRILVADDDEIASLTLVGFFEAEGHYIILAYDGPEALGQIRSERPDVVFLGLSLPNLDGLQVCRQIKADPQLHETYVILMGADENDDARTEALKGGADDFLQKPIDRTDLSERQKVAFDLIEYQRSLQAVALKDALTGLSNRRSFDAAIERETDRARCVFTPLSLLIIDIDHFKEINDRYGHHKGDKVLQQVAQAIVATLGIKNAVFRIGGDEFAVLLLAVGDAARSHLRRLQEAFPRQANGMPLRPEQPEVSIGMAEFDRAESAETFFSRADADMYENKRRRRPRHE